MTPQDAVPGPSGGLQSTTRTLYLAVLEYYLEASRVLAVLEYYLEASRVLEVPYILEASRVLEVPYILEASRVQGPGSTGGLQGTGSWVPPGYLVVL